MESRKCYTIDEVAKELGVSKTTVSRAISGKGRISAETRARVKAFIDTHDYRPNAVARGLAQSKTFNIALILPGDYAVTELPFFQTCMAGICEMASSQDYDVLLAMVTEGDASHLERILKNRKVDGAISTRTWVNDQVTKALKTESLPFVVVGTTNDSDVIHVDSAHREACKELTSILLMKGVERIGLIGGHPGHNVTQSRLAGFLDAFRELGKTCPDEMICLGQMTDLQIGKSVEELLERQAQCIIGMDDGICRMVLAKLQELELNVPMDIKVASFYNSATLDQNQPPITSLKFDAKELGRTACRLLLERLNGEEVGDQTLLGYQVVLRESTK